MAANLINDESFVETTNYELGNRGTERIVTKVMPNSFHHRATTHTRPGI